MDRTEIATANPSAAEDKLVALARELTSLRSEAVPQPDHVERIAVGLNTLSHLAQDCGKIRISKACKALSGILVRMDKGQEEDAAFILSTALNFLDAIQAKRIAGIGRKA